MPAGQAFWVLATANGEVSFSNSMRVSGNNQNLYKAAINEPVYVYLDVVNDSNNHNQCAIGYNETSTDGFDTESDAYKADLGTAIFLSSLSEVNGAPFVVQAVKKIGEFESKTVLLEIVTKNEGNHTFSVSRWQNVGPEINVTLKDTVTKDVVDLKKEDYSVNLTKGSYLGRFQLTIENTGNVTGVGDLNNIKEAINLIQKNNEIWVESLSANNQIQNVVVYDLLGHELINTGNVSDHQLIINASELKMGIYIIKTTLSNGEQLSRKMMFTE